MLTANQNHWNWKPQFHSKKSGCKNHRLRQQKKYSRTSSEKQFKELNEKLRSTPSDQQINWTMPAKTLHTIKLSQKVQKPKQWNKLNKNIFIAKTFTRRQNLIPKMIPTSKIGSKPFFVSEVGPVLYLQDLKKSSANENRLTQKLTEKFRKIEINFKFYWKFSENCDTNIFRTISVYLKAIQ